MEYLNTAQELLDFIMRCKSPFHVVKEAGDLLNENGYTKLEETKEWAGEHLREIEEVARKALKEAG